MALAIAIVGIAGTLLGVSLTAWLQRQNTLRERLRQDRVQVYSDFAAALMEYRRAQLERWHQPGDEEREVEARKARATAWHSLYRVQLLAERGTVYERAAAALESATALKAVPQKDGIGPHADRVRDLVDDFIRAARDEVHPTRPAGELGGSPGHPEPVD